MCLLVFAWQHHPAAPLVLVGNRDEAHARPAAAMDWWTDPVVLAGRDLEAGGTWLGVTGDGRFGVVTNLANGPRRAGAPSRGRLVPGYLASGRSPLAYLEAVHRSASAYSAFCLLLGDAHGVGYYSSEERAPRTLPPGVYGLGNFGLDTPEPKLALSRTRLQSLLKRSVPGLEPLFAIMADRTPAADALLDAQTRPLEVQRRLSAPFVLGAEYGTRCTTAMVRTAQALTVAERSFAANGAPNGHREFHLPLVR